MTHGANLGDCAFVMRYIVSVVARARRDAKLRFPCYAVTVTGDNN